MSEDLKEKLKSYRFWVSLASAVLLLVQAIGGPLGLSVDEETYMSIVNSVLGVFVVLGIISHPAQNLFAKNKETADKEENINAIDETDRNEENNMEENVGKDTVNSQKESETLNSLNQSQKENLNLENVNSQTNDLQNNTQESATNLTDSNLVSNTINETQNVQNSTSTTLSNSEILTDEKIAEIKSKILNNN